LAHQITKVTPANSLKTKEEIDLLHEQIWHFGAHCSGI